VNSSPTVFCPGLLERHFYPQTSNCSQLLSVQKKIQHNIDIVYGLLRQPFNSYPLMGNDTEDKCNVRAAIIVPCIESLLRNIEQRFGDNRKYRSIASNIFDSSNNADLIRDELHSKLNCQFAPGCIQPS
jgi:hypothetical protein